jgi:hypothetical protein
MGEDRKKKLYAERQEHWKGYDEARADFLKAYDTAELVISQTAYDSLKEFRRCLAEA